MRSGGADLLARNHSGHVARRERPPRGTADTPRPDPAGPDRRSLADRYRDRLVGLPLPPDAATRRLAIAAAVDAWLRDDGIGDADERRRLLHELVDDLAGLGPLEPLLADVRVTEILVDGPHRIVVEVDGRLEHTTLAFRDAEHLRSTIDRMLMGTGRRIDDGSPLVDACLADGSRLNAVLPPIAVGGPVVTIRRSMGRRLTFGELVDAGALEGRVAAFLHAAVLGRCNLVVSGGTGAGKTTLMAALAGLVPPRQRLVVLEDVAELRSEHPLAVTLECRPPGRDGGGEVALRDLVRNSLRMRPDRILVGEVRGAEAADMVQAMNTGHEGSMATLHANTSADAVRRLEGMLSMAWPHLSVLLLRSWIAAAIDVVIHCERSAEGRRRVVEVSCIDVDTAGGLTVMPVFSIGEHGMLRAHGQVPTRCLERMARNGTLFAPALFADDDHTVP